ncbi:ABC transporter ATP-binding protein [Anabaenopsis elenkinii]|jgi:iron(III) transport system ATP-binding protein|uniref:ABC-type quaternary amine transporter n=1 Tax=Anabaenopsis elenkinii CCIBt3563 TaxID=2779889 RepID=A0A7S6U4Z4_9CYAN|nr:ABC transporter ATP-binding protein [Anabaenopsis elenkinii]QOV23761.1 ABC transporter ATP-binding protein [Anabaenopsis elenkinii CCIBt3563]
MKPPIVQLQNVTKQFSANVPPAVNNVSLTLQQGDILGLLGPSGCGKTTLLRMIAGFENLQAGKIEIGGKIVCDRSISVPAEQRDIGIVFQDYALFPHLNVAENVAFGLKNASKQQIQKRINEVLELVNLQGLEKRYPYELSGGQQQRVALARALAPQPQLMLLDEPLSNLDIQVRLRLREEIRDILKAAGTSAIFVTHDQEEALAISDLVGVMRQGHLEQIGTPEEIYTHPASRFVAEFVTQANFLPARRQGNIWQTEVGNFELPVNLSNDTGEIMIRQEGLRLEPATDSAVFIHSRRFLGREYLYCLKTASGKEIHARTIADIPLPIGARVQLSVPNDTVQVFTP